MGHKRMRVDISAGLQAKLREEVERTGLNANQIVNMILSDYLQSLPQSCSICKSRPKLE